jgi:hypothetical protein
VLEPDSDSREALSKAEHPPPAAAATAMLRNSVKMTSIPSELIGAAGRRYLFKELIQEKPHLDRVWLAMSEHPCHSYHPTRELTTFQIRTRQICLEGYSYTHILRFQREYTAPASRKSMHTVTVGHHPRPAHICVQIPDRRLPEPCQESNLDASQEANTQD